MKACLMKAGALAILALGAGCSARAGDAGERTSVVREALANDTYFYLRCNDTDWNVDEGSRLKPTADPALLSVAVNARSTSDTCSVTQVTATAPDSWGTAQQYLWTSQTLAAPARAVLPSSGGNQTTFGVTYPSTGAFVATFDTTRSALAIAPSSAVEGRVTQTPGYGLTGTTVTLKGPSGATMGTTLTNANGAYEFPNLGPGSYSVAFAAGTASTQPTYAVTGTPATLLGTALDVEAICTPGSGAPCTAGPTVDDPYHRLIFVDPTITDPTQDPAASDAQDGHFSFRYVLETLSGCPNAATNAGCVTSFVKSFFDNVSSSFTVNGHVANHLNFEFLYANWPKLADGVTLDMTQTPFGPIAIVNRTDVHEAGQGEGRMVYGMKTHDPTTIIVEFALPSTASLPTRSSWVSAFYTLPITESHAAAIACQTSTNPSCQLVYNLQSLTDAFVSPAQLLDLRISNFADANPTTWTWSQLTLSASPGLNTLVRSAMPETPSSDLNGDPTLGAFLGANAAGIRSGFLSLPSSDLGGEALDNIVPNWSFAGLDATTLHGFSGRTCNGCHVFEGSDPSNPSNLAGPGFHVNPRVVPTGDGTNVLSPFVQLIEIPRRLSFMSHWLACGNGPCGAGAEIPLMQPNVVGM